MRVINLNIIFQNEWLVYCLTESGFLKFNSFSDGVRYISFKEYLEEVEKKNEERIRYWKVLEGI